MRQLTVAVELALGLTIEVFMPVNPGDRHALRMLTPPVWLSRQLPRDDLCVVHYTRPLAAKHNHQTARSVTQCAIISGL